MADEIVDLGKVRESKAKKFERDCQHTDSVGRRYQILRLTIERDEEIQQQRRNCGDAQISVDLLERRDG